MNSIKLVIKGFFIGFAKIIPGVSGAVLAILFGLYDKAIDAITNFFNDKKGNFYFLLYTGLGVLLAILFGSKIILYFLNKYEFVTLLFFIGLMSSSIWPLSKKINRKSINYFLIFLGILFTFLFMMMGSFSNNILGGNKYINFFILFLAGLVDAFASIFPGISGTALLIFMGVYEVIMVTLGSITNFSLLYENIMVLIPFSFGMLIGFLIFAKLINYLFKNYEEKTYAFIIGICIMSLLFLINMAFNLDYNITDLVYGFIFLFLGYLLSRKLDH